MVDRFIGGIGTLGVGMHNVCFAILSLASLFFTGNTCAVENYKLEYSSYIPISTVSTHEYNFVDLLVDDQNNIYIAGYSNSNVQDNAYVPGSYGDPDYGFSQGFIYKYSSDLTLVYTAYIQDADIRGIALDSSGRVYFTGSKVSNTYTDFCGNGTFVARLSSDGRSLDYCTIVIPAFGVGAPHAIAIDSSGNSYITGEHYGVPDQIATTNGVIQPTSAGSEDAYVIKLSEDGSQVLMATYIGGNGPDNSHIIALDSSDNIIVAGDTESSDLLGLNGLIGSSDAFVVKLSNDGTSVVDARYLGGAGADGVSSFVLDSEDNIYIAANTRSVDYPVTTGSFQTSYAGEIDSAITKLASDLSISFSTYLGGPYSSNAVDISLDDSSNIYVTGVVNGPGFPVTSNALQEIFPPSDFCGYFSKLSADGVEILYSTYFGSSKNYFSDFIIPVTSLASSIGIKSNGEVSLVGLTNSDEFPVTFNAAKKDFVDTSLLFFSSFNINSLEVTNDRITDSLVLNSPFSLDLAASGGTPPYEWFIEMDFMPTGLEFYNTGLITGVPTSMENNDRLYEYEPPLYPVLVGVKDQTNMVAYKELLAPFGFGENITEQESSLNNDLESSSSQTSSSSGGSLGYFTVLLFFITSFKSCFQIGTRPEWK